MTLYYRIQPAGLDISGHRSEASDDTLPVGIDVFRSAIDTLCTDVGAQVYGNEVLVIDAAEHWDNGDVEGVRIDPSSARVVARFSFAQWGALWSEAIEEIGGGEGFVWDGDGRLFESEEETYKVDEEEGALVERMVEQSVSARTPADA